jgi:predicted extracellular nuclease
LLTANGTLRAGDTIDGLTGVLDYGPISSGGSGYRLQPQAAPVIQARNPRPAGPAGVGGTLKIAGFNVENYFIHIGKRGAATEPELARQRAKLLEALIKLDADVLALSEVEKDGGAMRDLADGLNAHFGAGVYAAIDETAPGGDEIKSAILYRPARIQPVAPAQNLQVTNHPVYTPLFDRPPLIQAFKLVTNGRLFTLINAHLKAKSCSGAGGADSDHGQGCWNARRTAQAEAIAQAVKQAQQKSPDVLVMGDLNSYGGEDPIRTLQNAGLVNEIAARLPVEDQYTYIFDGQSGYLDQALASASLDGRVTGVAIWHINADEARIGDYRLKPGRADLYAPDAYRSSDHDPVLVGVDFGPAGATPALPLQPTLAAASGASQVQGLTLVWIGLVGLGLLVVLFWWFRRRSNS